MEICDHRLGNLNLLFQWERVLDHYRFQTTAMEAAH